MTYVCMLDKIQYHVQYKAVVQIQVQKWQKISSAAMQINTQIN